LFLEFLDNRIIGGESAKTTEFPWAVLIVLTVNDSYTFCGGALINEKTVLTAAHCVNKADLKRWEKTTVVYDAVKLLTELFIVSFGSSLDPINYCSFINNYKL